MMDFRGKAHGSLARIAAHQARYLDISSLGGARIQNKLGISSHTVKTHTYNVYKKLGVKNREELLDLVEGEK